jgi:hypothetical protein
MSPELESPQSNRPGPSCRGAALASIYGMVVVSHARDKQHRHQREEEPAQVFARTDVAARVGRTTRSLMIFR